MVWGLRIQKVEGGDPGLVRCLSGNPECELNGSLYPSPKALPTPSLSPEKMDRSVASPVPRSPGRSRPQSKEVVPVLPGNLGPNCTPGEEPEF